MNHPYIANLNGQEKYNQMLNDAEAHRRIQRISGNRPPFFKSLFSLIRKPGKSLAQKAGTSTDVRPTA